MKAIIHYSSGDREQDLEETDYFCPNCGAQDVWREPGPGDYCKRLTHYCAICGAAFTGPSLWQQEFPGGIKFEIRDE